MKGTYCAERNYGRERGGIMTIPSEFNVKRRKLLDAILNGTNCEFLLTIAQSFSVLSYIFLTGKILY